MNVSLTDRIKAEESTTIEEPPSRARDTTSTTISTPIVTSPPPNSRYLGKVSCWPEENPVQFLRDARAQDFVRFLSDKLHWKIECIPAKKPTSFGKYEVYAIPIAMTVSGARY